MDFLWRSQILQFPRCTAGKSCCHFSGWRKLTTFSMTRRKCDTCPSTLGLALTALDEKTRWGWGQATPSTLGDAKKRGLRAERKTFVRLMRWNTNGRNTRDVIDGVGESNSGWTKNCRKRRGGGRSNGDAAA